MSTSTRRPLLRHPHTARLVASAWLALAGLAGLTGPRPLRAMQVLTTIPACRILDTRLAAAGVLLANSTRDVAVRGGDLSGQGGSAKGCGIPGYDSGVAQSQALAINFVAVSPAGPGHLVAWPGHLPMPVTSILNFTPVAGLNIANGVVLEVGQDEGEPDLRLFAANSSVHVVADVVGYFTDLTLVDGHHSGLDAETVEGHTSEEILRPRSIFMGRAKGVVAGDGTNSPAAYAAPVGHSAAVAGDEAAVTVLAPVSCTAKDFQAYSTVAMVEPETMTVALLDNTQVLLSCTIHPGADTCDTAEAKILVAPGRRLAIRVTSNVPAGLSPRDVAFGWNCDSEAPDLPPHDDHR